MPGRTGHTAATSMKQPDKECARAKLVDAAARCPEHCNGRPHLQALRLRRAVSQQGIQPSQIWVSTRQLAELCTYLEWSPERGGFIEAQALGTLSMEVNGSGGYRARI
jgi:hypothetical protein